MSKHWKPAKKAVELGPPVRPSRIRRDPVRLEKKVEAISEEREIAGGVVGVLAVAAALAALIVVAPLAILALLVWLGIRTWRRREERRLLAEA